MTRVAVVALLLLAFLAAPGAAEAQPAGRVWRIGVLLTRDVRGGPEAFRQRLRDLGYFEGRISPSSGDVPTGDMTSSPIWQRSLSDSGPMSSWPT
jgi:hypothetical protein